jgi:hypothetical protein
MRTTDSERDSASELAQRIEVRLIEPTDVDEADRPAEDRSPGFANAILSEPAGDVEKTADVTPPDWELIVKALRHYAGCRR